MAHGFYVYPAIDHHGFDVLGPDELVGWRRDRESALELALERANTRLEAALDARPRVSDAAPSLKAPTKDGEP